MEWVTRMTDAIDFMERKLVDDIDIDEVAARVHASPFHFQRMSHMLTGFTVAEYIRKRRLTLAAQELAVASAKVLDVSFKYRYDLLSHSPKRSVRHTDKVESDFCLDSNSV